LILKQKVFTKVIKNAELMALVEEPRGSLKGVQVLKSRVAEFA
jgi:hypothetical protein